ncbi:MAG: NUDIX hydrolase [Anaerolineales bacterium]
MEGEHTRIHKLVADVCLLAEGHVLLVRYRDVRKYDGETGWFLPDDYLRHLEHPDEAARRILHDQAGITPPPVSLSHIESFEGNGAWHLIFHYRAELPRPAEVPLQGNILAAQWFPLGALPAPEEVSHGGWGLETTQKILSGR